MEGLFFCPTGKRIIPNHLITMLQLSYLRDHRAEAEKGLAKRGLNGAQLIEDALRLDEQRRENQQELDQTLAESNKLSKQIGGLYKDGKREEAEKLKAQTGVLKEQSRKLQEDQEQIKHALENVLLNIPNIPDERVPEGQDEAHNEIIREVDASTHTPAATTPHWELAERYGLIRFDLGVKITGAGFPLYLGRGARLQRALINFFLAENVKAGFTEVLPPHFVNADSARGTGQLPDKEGQMYHIEKDELYAIPTAEVPVTNIFRNSIMEANELPVQLTAYTPCFRREAGSYGKDVRGLNRLHQFDKVEIVAITKPENSEDQLEKMNLHVAALLEKLGLRYRILRLCAGDLGFTSALTYDFEVWSPAQERWLEVSSVSNFRTFQTNRMKIRYRASEKQTELCHSLNGSALALPRIYAAVMEQYQHEKGIAVPAVLKDFCGFDDLVEV